MASRWHATVIDARDPKRLARWWAEVLGFRVSYEDTHVTAIAGDREPGLSFVSASGDKKARNRIHLDIDPDDQNAEVERLVDMGARRVDDGRHRTSWIVLADPEGNEFCVLGRRDAD
ncbi:glyoxalase/bleomycin resistance protein/dioxygenase superfamily protein [Stackebrandtia albiflava]|uniref:Glyoxalase/bleomycin resistance protein/dioxygenase superfamily protein n=1 Tax=Stackebrandtia albiflava TaxID=406432 RepID=A0A562VAW6_9ACTN|nr:VOC family protein [Stackebrandtia albiflava]TWJ15004.1 glyoxalase/bleomycin resistance protein/dioxygenase superfamily protein [Stackebrandtia albiflava]